jgi:uncharacterized iron-regulated membrane protein
VSRILAVHRWLGLFLALFWIVQAASGIVLVFRWEIEDATVPGARVPVDLIALGKRIEATTRERGVVSSLWATSAAADRFDIYYTDSAAAERILRVDGAGRVLRDRASDLKVAEGAIFDSLTAFHRSLFAGTISARPRREPSAAGSTSCIRSIPGRPADGQGGSSCCSSVRG